MQPSGAPDWFEYRHAVPLTGREPLLGRLKTQLRVRQRGAGWITLWGPSGAGISRMLDEADQLIRETGAPRLLRIHPAPDARIPMAPLHELLRRVFPQPAGPALERALRAVHPLARDEILVLAAWLGDRPSRRGASALDPRLVRSLVERLAPIGPVLVDDLHDLDEATLAVLMPSAQGHGFGVIAGATDGSSRVVSQIAWEVEPLGVTQVELLLRRWLRHPATARRLAPALTKTCDGLPGRVIEAVRRMARAGELELRGRSVVVTRAPETWPDGRRTGGAFLQWIRTQGAPARRVLEVAAVQGTPDDVALLADAAGVKRSFARALLDEAVAARGGLASARYFATRAKQRAYRERMSPAARSGARARLEAAWTRRVVRGGAHRDDAVRRLRLVAMGSEPGAVGEGLAACLEQLPVLRTAEGWHLDVLAEAAARLSAGDAGVAHVAHRLWHAGRESAARALLGPAALSATPSAAHLLAQARHRQADEARTLLAEGLPCFPVQQDAIHFDAWALLAKLDLSAGDPAAARRAWRHAAPTCAPGDLERSARWHEGLAACATADDRPRAAASHRRRAVRLRLMHGDVHAAGELLLALGSSEIRHGRLAAALEPLQRAGNLLRLLGDARGTAEANLLAGRTLMWLDDYDRAADRLRVALAAAESSRASRLLPRIHLALASAFRGCGDLLRERHHAEMAAGLASTALGRVKAAAVLARADLRAGVPGADHLLVRCERDLRSAGFEEEADRARAALVDASLRSGDAGRARDILPVGPQKAVGRMAAARLHMAAGRVEEACAGFELLGADTHLPVDLRATCYAHLADALRTAGRLEEARAAAVAASSLLEVTRRNRADDVRLHDVLARVFRGVGDDGRAVGHRFAARRGMRTLARAASDPRERRRLMRNVWRRDPRPGRDVG